MKKILLGLTTTPYSDWRAKVKEIARYHIKEIALFPTFLTLSERKELYALLEEFPDLQIPHVHLRGDMDEDEIGYFVKRFKTKVFNIHTEKSKFGPKKYYPKYAAKIYVENIKSFPTVSELKKYAGFCLDCAHWENMVLMDYASDKELKRRENILKSFKVGCAHISAIKKKLHRDRGETHDMRHDSHYMDSLSNFDYIKRYAKYLPNIISIELEDSFKKQLKVKKCLEKILNN